jgi:hypothetical protein
VNCLDCGTPVNVDRLGTWVEVVGWTVKRTGGGANRRDLTPTGRVVCADCGRLRDLDVVPGQSSLWDNR